jgi:hypothetical protein
MTTEKVVGDSPSNGSDHDHVDHEKHIQPGGVIGYDKQPGQDGIPENFREQDFMTRNGLNFRSFQRRASTLADHRDVFLLTEYR